MQCAGSVHSTLHCIFTALTLAVRTLALSKYTSQPYVHLIRRTSILTYVGLTVYNLDMRTNPGGQLDPKDIRGRDKLIHELWETLGKQSVIMTAERRIGKTSIMQKMLAEAADNWLPIYQDVEQCHSALEFASAISEKIAAYIDISDAIKHDLHKLRENLKSIKLGSISLEFTDGKALTWEQILEQAVESLMSEQGKHNHRLVFMLDEVPYMLANIKEKEGEATAKKLLDTLRYLRNEYKDFRILITGSIGLHHVLSELKASGYRNQPLAGMYQLEVTPLERKHAEALATELLKGESLHCAAGVPRTIAAQADNFPFYIHHIIKSLKTTFSHKTILPEDIEAVVKQHLTAAHDPWELRHYLERIPSYYGEQKETANLILDELALQSQPVLAKNLQAVLQGQSNRPPGAEDLRQLLSHMVQDHYLSKDATGGYSFRFPLIKRWWKQERELE